MTMITTFLLIITASFLSQNMALALKVPKLVAFDLGTCGFGLLAKEIIVQITKIQMELYGVLICMNYGEVVHHSKRVKMGKI